METTMLVVIIIEGLMIIGLVIWLWKTNKKIKGFTGLNEDFGKLQQKFDELQKSFTKLGEGFTDLKDSCERRIQRSEEYLKKVAVFASNILEKWHKVNRGIEFLAEAFKSAGKGPEEFFKMLAQPPIEEKSKEENPAI
jgi:hypothetical protein